MNSVLVSAETHWEFRTKPKLAAAQPAEKETRPKLNFLPISAPKPKFGRSLTYVELWQQKHLCWSFFSYSTNCIRSHFRMPNWELSKRGKQMLQKSSLLWLWFTWITGHCELPICRQDINMAYTSSTNLSYSGWQRKHHNVLRMSGERRG